MYSEAAIVQKQRWINLPVGGASFMERINLSFFFDLGANLNPLSRLTAEPEKRIDILLAGFSAMASVQLLLDSYPSLTVCRTSGTELARLINDLFTWFQETPSEKRKEVDADPGNKFHLVVTKAKEFQTVLSAELQQLAAYHLTPKGIYATDALVARAVNMIPEALRKEVPKEAQNDLDQAGRCLAFDLPTASGFHAWRGVETVLKAYCKEFGASTKRRNWNAYITELKKTLATPKVVAVLDQLRDLHRNPTMHPDEVLTEEEASSLLGIVQSAIVAMLRDILSHRSKQPPSVPTPATP